MPGGDRSRALRGAVLLAVVVGTLGTFDLGSYPLWDPDEGRHAEIAREMAASSGLAHFWLPTLEFRPYHEKPAPYYWMASAALRLFGETEWAARSVSTGMGLMTILATYAYAVPHLGSTGAILAALVLATQSGWFWLARYGSLDMTFTGWVTLAVLAGLAWLERTPPRRPPYLVYIALGLALLVKGPLAIALVGAPLLAAAGLGGTRPSWRELSPGSGMLLVGAIAAVFYVPAAILDPSYIGHFLHTHLRRLEATAPHHAPVWFYGAWLPVLVLPWSALLVPAAAAAARDPAARRWLAWAVLVPALMTAISSKLGTYLLPALPAVALVLAPAMARCATDSLLPRERFGMTAAAWVTAAGFAAAAAGLWFVKPSYPVPGVRVAVSAVLAAASALLIAVLRRNYLQGIPAIVLATAIAIDLLLVRLVAPVVGELHSDKAMAAAIAVHPDAPVIAFDTKAASLAFYRRQPAVHTSNSSELAAFAAAERPLFVVVGQRHVKEVEEALGARSHLWIATPRRRLYATMPPPEPSATH